MNTIKFSIIVPIYNNEKFLAECIDSLINQVYQNVEIILVNDGSQDACPAICDKYAAKDIRIKVIHKKNGGIVSARQAGVAASTGDYIVCVDGDDWISENYLEEAAKVINHCHPDIVCCGHYIVSKRKYKKKPLPHRYGYYTKKNIEEEIFPILIQKENATYFSQTLWAKIFKRELYIKQQLVDVVINIGEDGACTIPCIYHANSLFIMQDCLYYYRYNTDSITKSRKSFQWDGPKIIMQHLEKQIDINQYNFKEQLYRKTVHELFSVVVSQFYKNDSYNSIVKDININLDDPVYDEAIQKCNFSGSLRAIIMSMALKFRLMIPIWIYSKVK